MKFMYKKPLDLIIRDLLPVIVTFLETDLDECFN